MEGPVGKIPLQCFHEPHPKAKKRGGSSVKSPMEAIVLELDFFAWPFRHIPERRRRFIDAHKEYIDGSPLLFRLWYRYGHWARLILRHELKILRLNIRLLAGTCALHVCEITDGVLGTHLSRRRSSKIRQRIKSRQPAS